jgi:methylornithine synthase
MSRENSWRDLETILAEAYQGKILSGQEIKFLLRLSDEDQIGALFQTARVLRSNRFGENIFLYGFIYLSTYCRNDCPFCFFRKSNQACQRYRKKESEIVEAACQLAASGVHVIDLTMGEDPEYFHNGATGFEKLVKLVQSVKSATGLPIMVSPGVVPDDVLTALKAVGETWYACYQETYNCTLFNQLRPKQSYDTRFQKKVLAHRIGLLIEEGLLSGVGESIEDVADSIFAMRALDADQVRVMSFIPQKGTPMEDWVSPERLRELLTIAVMRLIFQDRLIPASLDVDGLAGLKPRLDAGANVVTSLVPSNQGLVGVAQSSLDIEDSRRSSASVLPILKRCGLNLGNLSEYNAWIDSRRKTINKNSFEAQVSC